MACIITYENKQYTQKEFEQYFKEHFTEFVDNFLGSKQDIEGFKEFVNRLQFQKSTTQSDTNQSSINNQQIQYQKLGILRQDLIPEESAIRDLAARLADRIGGKVDFINKESEKYAGYNEGNKSTINLHYATLDTPLHEIIFHPLVRALKEKSNQEIDSHIENLISQNIIEKQC